MREISADTITRTVELLCLHTVCRLDDELIEMLTECRRDEDSPLAREILGQIIENARIAAEESVPSCQDTGTPVFFIELGREAVIAEPGLQEAVDRGVRRACRDAYLRASIVADPFRRENTGDNTPAIIHLFPADGERLSITLMAKGAGSENMSVLKMFTPSAEREEIIDFIVEVVREAGPNPCPPLIVGIGLGGNFEEAPLLAKRALLRPFRHEHPDPFYARMEQDLLERINQTGIGPAGLGGKTTCLNCHIIAAPCHIASLPVAVNLQCHAARHKTAVI